MDNIRTVHGLSFSKARAIKPTMLRASTMVDIKPHEKVYVIVVGSKKSVCTHHAKNVCVATHLC